ncbi:MAG: tetratricopeptide repeat protein [Deltaproteobacteria bacterium]|nr:tetratricopeptide repeat protein [Deltaproteobacteria bacterium]
MTSQVVQNPANSRAERRKKFAATVAIIKEDPHDVRARLSVIELLQEEGRTDEAVQEMMRVAAVYARRGVPIKAVAVMRTAVKLRPERADVRMAYGEVFEKLKMVDDAAREFRAAWDLFLQQNNLGGGLDALGHLLQLDPAFVPGHVVYGEALGRAGRVEQAAEVFRRLADHLLSLGATADWEKVAERAVFFDPSDVTLAHDLALHYVRTGRHAAALAKLIVCFEAEPNDGELTELIVEVLEALGQPERAAALLRVQVGRYRRGGLEREAQTALERLAGLDPDDPEARAAVGADAGAVAAGAVIALAQESGIYPAVQVEEDDEPGFGSGPAPSRPAASRPPPVPVADEAPPLPVAALEPDFGSRGGAAFESQSFPIDSEDFGNGLPLPVARAPEPAPVRKRAEFSATAPERPSMRRTVSRPTLTRVGQASGGRPVSGASATEALDATAPLIPIPERAAPRLPTRQRAPSSGVVVGRADDDEAGFDGPESDRTIIDPSVLAAVRTLGEAPSLAMPASRPTEPQLEPPADPRASRPLLNARRRSNNLPRPKLVRSSATSGAEPAGRSVSNDLKTLDFFIERGFYESAVALFAELERRHPNSEELRVRSARIAAMARR